MLPPPNEDRRIAELMRRVDNLESALRAAFTTISGGRGLRVNGGGGVTIEDGGQFAAEYPIELGGGVMMYVGQIASAVDGTYQGTGLLLQAPDGTDMMVIRTDANFGTTMHNIYDSGGRVIFGNDAASGQGHARPWLSGGFTAKGFANFRYSTTSSTWETLCDQLVTKQQPRLQVGLRASMDTAGTTGEVRVLVNGTPLGAVAAEGFAISTRYFGPEAVAGDYGDDLLVEIQGQRTSASGTLRLEPRFWKGRQS